MTGPAEKMIEVAPREIHDLVYTCCRVRNLDAGAATAVAEAIATCEVQFGNGLTVFSEQLEALAGANGTEGSLASSPLVTAPDQWREAEVHLRRHGHGHAILQPAAPLAALGSVIAESIGRGIVPAGPVHDLLTGAGVVSVDGSTIVEGSTMVDGSTVLEVVELVADFELDEIRARWAERRRRAMANGVMVPAAAHRRLKEVAAEFLVSESAVDTVSEGE